MKTRHRVKAPVGLFVLLAMGLVLAAAAWPTTAGAQQSAAVLSAVTGRVEVLPPGQTAWQPARLGMRVFEEYDIRAYPAANAELRLPDGSTVFVAENTRFVVTKLDFTPRNQMRAAFFHLAVGKLRGIVAKAAVALVAARQSNFAISTPTAVAAVRGTTVYAVFDAATNTTTILVTDGIAIIRDITTGQLVTVQAGQVVTAVQGQAISAPTTPTPAQAAAIQSAAQAANQAGNTVMGASTVATVKADVVLVQILPAAAPAAAPTIIVTPAPPPLVREASPSKP